MKPRLYLETTIPSYLAAWPSRDLIRAGHQQICEPPVICTPEELLKKLEGEEHG